MTRKIDSRLFWAIKTMLKGGATIKETAEYFQLGAATVGRVKSSESLEEYRNTLAAIHAKSAAKSAPKSEDEEKPVQVIERPQIVQIQASHFMLQQQQRTNELLELISRKLAFIVDQLS